MENSPAIWWTASVLYDSSIVFEGSMAESEKGRLPRALTKNATTIPMMLKFNARLTLVSLS